METDFLPVVPEYNSTGVYNAPMRQAPMPAPETIPMSGMSPDQSMPMGGGENLAGGIPEQVSGIQKFGSFLSKNAFPLTMIAAMMAMSAGKKGGGGQALAMTMPFIYDMYRRGAGGATPSTPAAPQQQVAYA